VRPSPRAAVRVLPGAPGVYRFRDAERRVLYVGRATHLRRRVGSYWGELGDRRHLRAMVPSIAEIEAVECASEHEAAWLERNLLEGPLPPWNRTPGGQEVVVCIRVDSSARSPGISVQHLPVARTDASSGVRYFGPYLGGARVRLAAAGLHRVLPLRYTSDGQSSLLRELGVSRGVDEADREALAASLYAVLGKEPAAVAAVRAQLAELRDAAAAGEAYEVAGRIQTELSALEWITCQQRAAVLEAREVRLAGWVDGVLVRFDMRAGRLTGWRKLVRSRAQAQPWLAATPPEWREFAERNAELAARLLAATAGASAEPAVLRNVSRA
jgi:excinuclease ABC subunit C